MVDFKIGDRVRAVVADDLGWDVGDETDIVIGHLGPLGVIDREGQNRYFCDDEWVLAEPANNELAELRAFKEAAIARFPELAAKVDPDLAEAKSLMQGSDWSSGTECDTPDDPDFEGSVCDVVLKGIKRGRELERYAQGLTTPKD